MGGHVRERELGPHNHVTKFVIVRPGHVTIPGRRGGGAPPRPRSRDTRQIGGEMRALSLLGPMQRLNSKSTRNMHLLRVHARQSHIGPPRLFIAHSALNINLKGVHMKLKIVALAISVE